MTISVTTGLTDTRPSRIGRLSLTIACIVVLAMPSPTYQWRRDGNEAVCHQTGYEVAHLYSGRVRGRRQKCDINFKLENKNPEIREVVEYLGIPYAAPPIGKLRFKKTREIEPWTVTKDALRFGARCVQRWPGEGRDQGYSDSPTDGPNHKQAGMSENCLFANVFTPEIKQDIRYPVMVFIHGGSYVYGTGNRYNGTSLAYKGAVVITFNYRLGALGFLTTGDARLSGNYGLYDQLQLLHWVRRNAATFGGDASKVTIFGSSAGAASGGILFLSPLAKGLFHRVIAQSGVANAMWASHQDRRSYRDQVRQVANATYCLRKTMQDSIDCIMHKESSLFEEDQLCKRMKCKLIDPVFKPVVDGELIVDDINRILKNGQFPRDIPMMTGTVKTEFGSNTKKDLEGMPAGLDSYLKENYSPRSRHLIAYEYSSWSSDQAQNHLQFTDENYDRSETLSDLGLVAPTGRFAQSLVAVESGDTPTVYLYYLEREDESYHSLDLNDVFGACYLGNNVTFDELGDTRMYNHRDFDRSEQLMRIWVNFANTGKPLLNEKIWPPVSKKHLNFLNFRTTEKETVLKIRRDYYAKKAYFWGRLLTTAEASSSYIEPTGLMARSEEDDRGLKSGANSYFALAGLAMICLVGSLIISGFWNISLWKRTRRYHLEYEHRIYI